MFGIDTCQEWALAVIELIAIILIACVGIVGAIGMIIYYLGKAIWHRDTKYLWEDV